MKERTIEEYLAKKVAERGGLCEKFISPGRRGVPDRLITWPNGHMELVETKAPLKGPRADQRRDHARRATYGIHVSVLSSKELVDWYVDRWRWRTHV